MNPTLGGRTKVWSEYRKNDHFLDSNSLGISDRRDPLGNKEISKMIL